ncbi:phosphotransacetylase family protein [Geobacter benzoatilyticus]|jgi:BioD-like phosphotransacetylase family protein|uniref:AAA family ATPase n=1 Tax=Geobacter benzoatilyticus TaxID=2815309 RepID=A0ABX7Q1X5_9BACT|nr:AAA family ATPase [Geobacter benzoatilyticus]QSV45098.1 AAA family ATPase [Geobacter benzoatilyticus]
MAKKIFIGATGQNCGKTTMSVSLMHLARQKYRKVGFIKPIGPKIEAYNGLTVDMDAILMARTFGLEEDLPLMNPVPLHKNFTRDFLSGKIDCGSLRDKVLESFEILDKKYDLLIIEGAGHSGVGSVIGLSNACVAHTLNAPVIIVTDSGIGSTIDAVHLNLALYEKEDVDVRMVLVNKLRTGKRDSILSFLGKGLPGRSLKISGGFNYSPILANPTLSHIGKLLNLSVHGDPDGQSRIIHHIHLGAASAQRVVDALEESTLIVITSSRDELIVTISSLYHIPSFREKIAGLVIAGHVPTSEISQQILDDSDIPYIRVHDSTANVFTTLMEDVAKITAEDQEKLNWIRANAENEIDFEAIEALL